MMVVLHATCVHQRPLMAHVRGDVPSHPRAELDPVPKCDCQHWSDPGRVLSAEFLPSAPNPGVLQSPAAAWGVLPFILPRADCWS